MTRDPITTFGETCFETISSVVQVEESGGQQSAWRPRWIG